MPIDPTLATAPSTPAERPSPARAAIFDAATRLFGEQGYTGTSMREIARAVGLLPGSLYAHIESKEGILLEIIEAGVDRFIDAVDEVDELGLPAADALREAIRRHLAIVADNPQRTLIVFHQWRYLDDENRHHLLAKRARYEEFFYRTLHRGMTDGAFDATLNPKVTVLCILGALNWTPEWFSPSGPVPATDLADLMAASLLGGVLRPGTPYE